MIDAIRQATGYGIRQICASLQVPRSPSAMSPSAGSGPCACRNGSGPNGCFYHAASPTPTQSEDRRIGDLIEAIFKRHRRREGVKFFL